MANPNAPLDLADLNSAFRPLLNAYTSGLDKAGIGYRIDSGYRSPEQQAAIYARSNQGRSFAVAPPWRSFHNYGLAADVIPNNPADYARMHDIARQVGLYDAQGGTRFGGYDPPHVEMPGTLAGDIAKYNLAGWRPASMPAPATGAIAYSGPSAPIAPAATAIASAAPQGNLNAPTPPPRPYPTNRANTTAAQRDAFNRAYAQSIGYNPDVVSGISRAEGLNAGGAGPSRVDVQGGQPYSWGDFQLNVRNGLGTIALAQGINPADPNQWQKANMFAINQMAKGGVGPWKGDPYARNLLASGKAPAPMGQGGIGSDAVASGTAGAPATPTVGSAIASLTQPPAGGGPSPLQSAAKEMGIGQGDQGGGGDQPSRPSDSGLAQSMQQSAMAGQARQQQIQQQAAQLAAQWRQAGMQPLTWGSRPYGSTAGPQQQIPGTTLNSIGG